MTGSERAAAAITNLLGVMWTASGVAVLWMLVAAQLEGSLLPLPRMIGAAIAYALPALAAGAAHLYAGPQISYSIPGWQKEGAALLLGSAGAGVAIAYQVSLVGGAAIALTALIGAVLLWRQDLLQQARLGRGVALVTVGIAVAVSTVVGSTAARDLPEAWQGLMPAPDQQVSEATLPLLQGRVDHAHLTPGGERLLGLSVAGLIEDSLAGPSVSLGSTDLETCDTWGVQAHAEFGGGSLRLLSVSSASAVGLDFWVQADGVRYRAPSGETSFRAAHDGSMLPHIRSLRDFAIAGALDTPPGLCSVLQALPSLTEVLEVGEQELSLIVRPGDAERAARVGDTARQHRNLLQSGWPEPVAALLTLTRARIPDLGELTSLPRTITIVHRDGVLRGLLVRAYDGRVIETVVVEPAALTPPPLPDPARQRSPEGLRLLGPGRDL